MPAGTSVPIAVIVRNRGPRPALGFRVCHRLPRGLGVARLGGASLRDKRVCWPIARGGNVRRRDARLRIACSGPLPRFTG